MAQYDEVIPAGQSGKILATLSTKNYRGKLNKSILVESNDLSNTKVKLEFHCSVLGVKVLPVPRVYFNARLGVGQTKELTIATIGENSLTVYARPSNPNFDVKLEKLTNEKRPLSDTDYWNQYKLLITIPKTSPEGRISGTVTLVTDSEYDPTIKIYVSGRVHPTVVVSPSVVRLTTNDNGKIEPKLLKITQKYGEGLKISKIVTSPEQLKASLTETKKRKQYTIKLVWDDGESKGVHSGKVVLYTNDEQKSVIHVPVFINSK